MARHKKDIMKELLILQIKMDTIYKACLHDSMTKPLLWVHSQDAFDDTTLAKLKAGFTRHRASEI